MVRILILVSQRNFSDIEFNVIKKNLKEKEVSFTVASITKDNAIGMDGTAIKPDKSLREINPNNYDAFIIIGGPGSPKLIDYPEVMSVLKKFNEKGKIIAAICLAPMILAKAGILKGVISTVFPVDFAIGVLKQEGATYSQEHIVEDDNIITADGPQAAKEFTDKILKRFNL